MADVTARSLQYEYKAVSMHMNEPFTKIANDVVNLGSSRLFNYFWITYVYFLLLLLI